MSERRFEEMFMKELVKQMLEETESKMDSKEHIKVGKESEEIPDSGNPFRNLYKLSIDLAYKSAWESEKDWLKDKLKTACKDLYSGRADEEFPFTELFFIGLYGLVARERPDLNEDEFISVVNENCNLINDLY